LLSYFAVNVVLVIFPHYTSFIFKINKFEFQPNVDTTTWRPSVVTKSRPRKPNTNVRKKGIRKRRNLELYLLLKWGTNDVNHVYLWRHFGSVFGTVFHNRVKRTMTSVDPACNPQTRKATEIPYITVLQEDIDWLNKHDVYDGLLDLTED
jgi:hypothetical protein